MLSINVTRRTVVGVLSGAVFGRWGMLRGVEGTPVATYSVVGFDERTGDLGVAVQSKFFGVGSVVPWAKAGVGAVATQSYANTDYGPEGLRMLADGKNPDAVVSALTASDPDRELRQVGVVDAQGRAASFTGRECLVWAGHRVGRHYAAQGNILAGEAVVTAMAEAFEAGRDSGEGALCDWLLAALVAAEGKGGDVRGRQSSALLVVRKGGGYGGKSDRFVDLRVEDHVEPNAELGRLLGLHKRFYAQEHSRRVAR
jgi:uncharacterized Ntn-hydrolase superfamily protein